jgi:hypothetical protein
VSEDGIMNNVREGDWGCVMHDEDDAYTQDSFDESFDFDFTISGTEPLNLEYISWYEIDDYQSPKCDFYLAGELVGSNKDYCDFMRGCEYSDDYGGSYRGYFTYGLADNLVFRNIASGSVFKVDCTPYADLGCDEDAATGFSMYSLFNELSGEWVYYV